ncbi:sensor domain-containing protein [Bordetella genomosp. 12]|uniref:Bifunctional diguanylate cyclase/phosphodiesterase n=1 Tax=Bordetella genomosp. 12 TaxID=463035 RepID=A0A261VFJ0_9BORD|nr:EAL domain-containing protein [Bordetella genomosp. 12]OZI72312.1 bifunctional diguanylate cyclase/phosphodiesterase [Bordetella genomosp. 12]
MFKQSEPVDRPMAQLEALNRLMALAEYSPDGRLRRANDLYLSILGLQRQEVLGRQRRSFCPGITEDADFWPRLLAGEACSIKEEQIGRDGKSCWLQASYTPVFSPEGNIQHILKAATDITEQVRQEQLQLDNVQRLTLAADATDTAVIMADDEARFIYANAGFTRMFGWNAEEVMGQHTVELLTPHLGRAYAQARHKQLLKGVSSQLEEIVVGKQGQRYWAKIITNPIFGSQGRITHIVTMFTDITHAKLHEALQQQVLEAMVREQALTDVLELVCKEVERIAPEIATIILEVDHDAGLRTLAAPSLPPHFCQELQSASIGAGCAARPDPDMHQDGGRVEDHAIELLCSNCLDMVLPQGFTGCCATPIRSSQNTVVGYFAFYYRQPRNAAAQAFHQSLVDACTHLCALALEREHARQRIRQLAFYDDLTGIPNRNLLLAKAAQAITAAVRNKTPLAVLFIDLDRFKQVNDTLGHIAGDELLRTAADRMRARLRPNDLMGRLSGDDFVVVLPNTDADRAADVVEHLQNELAQPLRLANTDLSVSACVGVALFPTDGKDMDTLLQRADLAMHEAKAAGRGGFSFFSADMNRLAQERLALENDLRLALKKGLLRLDYQPQIALASGRLYGVEALARWTHPTLGEIPPSRFIPLAEECGLIADLGRWAVRTACRQLAEWRASGMTVPAVSVNLSPTSFHNPDLPRMISETLRRHGLAPDDLTLELTESILLDTHPSTMRTIAQVHALGVRLSMDDFGTGYSSLSYLRRLPVSELKLDRSFVADLDHDAAASALSAAILGIGESLQLTVVAEGVETATQNQMLRDQGYPVAQGHLFSRPLPATELENWLRRELPAVLSPARGAH